MPFGVARELITPPVKTHMGGYGSLYGRYFTGIHDDLYVKTLVLDDGGRKAVLMSLDLLFHDFELTEHLGDYILERYGVPKSNLVLSYTHTHAGPAVRGYDPGQHSDEYEAFLLDRLRRCVDRAFVNAFDGTVAYGVVEGDWNVCRRKKVAGVWRNAPNFDAPRDSELALLTVRDGEGRLRAIVTNYSCHPVTLGDTLWISAEYPGRLCQLLETAFYGSTAMFFQSAGGCSIPKVAAPGGRRKKCSFGELDTMAADMARAASEAISSGTLRPVNLKIAARRFVIPLETEVYPKAYFEGILNDPAIPHGPKKNEARLVLERYDTTDNVVRLNASIVRLNPRLYIAFLCGEVTYPVKQLVKRAFGGHDVIFIGYGDASAYIPDDRYISEGGYETDGSVVEFCLKGRFKPGVDERIIAAYREHLAEIERSDGIAVRERPE